MSRWRRLIGGEQPIVDEAWVRSTQRLERAVVRYNAQVSVIRDRGLRIELQNIGEMLDGALADIERLSVSSDPRRSTVEIPDRARRALARASTLTAHATEAALLAGDARWNNEPDAVSRALDSVRTLVKAVRELADACLEAAD